MRFLPMNLPKTNQITGYLLRRGWLCYHRHKGKGEVYAFKYVEQPLALHVGEFFPSLVCVSAFASTPFQ